MKRILADSNRVAIAVVAASLLAVDALSQGIGPSEAPYAIVSRDGNQRVLERTDYDVQPDGSRVPRVHQVVELATGMHYKDTTGNWVESKEEIEIVPGGAVARQGQHKVIFGANLNTVAAIELETPDGKRLQSTVLGLSYFDSASGKSVVIAEVQDCQGQVSGNRVLYPDAFDGLKADVRYTYTRAGFEQDVILREQPPGPEEFGLNPATTTLQVLTEFYSPPQPATRAVRVPEGDTFLDFGAAKIGRGKAFLIGDEPNGILVRKQWLKIEGRDILVEEIPMPNLRDKLETLPKTAMIPASNSVIQTASKEHLLPAARAAKATKSEMKLAKSTAPTQGLVLDYYTLMTGYWGSDYTFQGGATYYVSGPFNVGGTLTLEGGVVIKYDHNISYYGGSGIVAYNGIRCDSTYGPTMYRPVVITDASDDSVGEVISGSTGTPSTFNCAGLVFDVGSSLLTPMEHLHIRYALRGLEYWQGTTPLRHCQFVNVGKGILNYTLPLTVENVLFSGVTGSGYVLGADSGVHGSFNGVHLTVDDANHLLSPNSTLTAVNSLFVNVPDMGSATLDQDTCREVTWSPPQGSPFTERGGGRHYLEDGNYRIGTLDISPDLLRDLQSMTTFPPGDPPSGTVITSSETWSTLVPREYLYEPLMIGYHYAPLDYLLPTSASGVTLNNGATLNLSYVTVGITKSYGFILNAGSHFSSQGGIGSICDWMNQIVLYSAVQEEPVTGAGPTISIFNIPNIPSPGTAPTIQAHSTGLSGLGTRLNFFNASVGPQYFSGLTLQDCQLSAINLVVWAQQVNGNCAQPASTLLQNNLFEQCMVRLYNGCLTVGGSQYQNPMALNLHNNTFWNGILWLAYQANNAQCFPPWNITDNLRAGGGLLTAGSGGSYQSHIITDHNAYTAMFPPAWRGPGDVLLTSLVFAEGPLGHRYIDPATSPTLEDAGSRDTYTAGLSDHTIRADQTSDGNGGNGDTVDIGFHYPIAIIHQIPPPVLTAVCGPDRILLLWTIDPSQENLVADFQILRSTTPGGPYTVIHTADAADRSYEDTTVTTGVTYCYVAVPRPIDFCTTFVTPSDEVCISTCSEPPCDEPVISGWLFTDEGFIGPNGNLDGGFRAYNDPSSVTASPWSFPTSALCITSSTAGLLLRMNFENDNNCTTHHGLPNNPNTQVATAEAAISLGCETRLTVDWCGFGERYQEPYDKMFLYVDDVLVAATHAPGDRFQLECEGGMGPVVSEAGFPNPPVSRVLQAGLHLVRIKTDTVDENFHYGAYYEFKISFQPQ